MYVQCRINDVRRREDPVVRHAKATKLFRNTKLIFWPSEGKLIWHKTAPLKWLRREGLHGQSKETRREGTKRARRTPAAFFLSPFNSSPRCGCRPWVSFRVAHTGPQSIRSSHSKLGPKGGEKHYRCAQSIVRGLATQRFAQLKLRLWPENRKTRLRSEMYALYN